MSPSPPIPRRRHVRRRPAASALFALALALVVVAGGLGEPRPVAAQVADEDPGLEQTIEEDQELVAGPAVLEAGHVDVGPRWIDGEWTLLVHDDAEIPSVWRRLDDVVLRVDDDARQPVPDDPTYDFLGIDPGTQVHVVPQIEAPGVVWVGWNTQDPEVLERIDLGATLTLRRVQGPGSMTMYLQSGNLGEPEVLWDSRTEEAQPLWVEVNTHTHANWVFSDPGTYLVEVEVSAELVDGEQVSDVQTLRFAVGDETDVETTRTAEWATAALVEDEGDEAASVGDDAGDEAASGGAGPAVLLLVVGGALLLLAAVAFAVGRGARAKRAAEAERRAGAAPR